MHAREGIAIVSHTAADAGRRQQRHRTHVTKVYTVRFRYMLYFHFIRYVHIMTDEESAGGTVEKSRAPKGSSYLQVTRMKRTTGDWVE